MPHENACQGLPDGPCPKQRQDSSVIFTIYDLFLCPNCITAREQAAGGTNGNAAAAATVTAMTNEMPTKAAKKQTRKADSAAATRNTRQQTKQNVTNINDEAATQPAPTERNDEVALLRQVVELQQHEIEQLKNKLKYVLSYLGIDRVELEGAVESSSTQYNRSTVELAGGDERDNARSVDDASIQPENSSVPLAQAHQRQSSKFQQSMIAAVYVDQSLKQHRQKSLIVSGLAPSTTVSDVQQFKSLCEVEFNISPNVTTTKRLGRPLQDKIQPLLVVLQQASQAQQLITKARELRQSQNETVRTMIYINPNLTRAEAEAAYRIRVERRESGKRRSIHSAQQMGQQQQEQSASQTESRINNTQASTNIAGEQIPSVINSGSTNGRQTQT
jgi:hypothetical protein